MPTNTIPRVESVFGRGRKYPIAQAKKPRMAADSATLEAAIDIGSRLGKHSPSNKVTGRDIGEASWTALSSA